MVRAILDGRKNQTRRIVNPSIAPIVNECFKFNGKWCNHTFGYELGELCPYGIEGNRLWVRETFRHFGNKFQDGKSFALVTYRQDGSSREIEVQNPPKEKWWNTGKTPWKPSIYMRRWASRITLEITGVRVDRLQDISRDDAAAEGVDCKTCPTTESAESIVKGYGVHKVDYVAGYKSLWKSINGKGSWDANPWVWCLTFKKL